METQAQDSQATCPIAQGLCMRQVPDQPLPLALSLLLGPCSWDPAPRFSFLFSKKKSGKRGRVGWWGEEGRKEKKSTKNPHKAHLVPTCRSRVFLYFFCLADRPPPHPSLAEDKDSACFSVFSPPLLAHRSHLGKHLEFTQKRT